MTKICVIAGVGPGNGLSLGKRFSKAGFKVVLLARNEEQLQSIAEKIENASWYACDITNQAEVITTFDRIRDQHGGVDTLIYNAGAGIFGSIEEIEADQFEMAWRVNTLGCYLCCRQVITDMKKTGGNIVIIGATASKRGGAKFAAFTSAKAAQYTLAQSMARHLGTQGIHVSYVVIDGVIDIPRTRARFPDRQDNFFLKPDDIAESVYQITQQASSAWTFEFDIRPSTESW